MSVHCNLSTSLATSFLESMQSLTTAIQKKTWDAIERFLDNPDAGGRNLEKISNQMYSMRVDLAYRVILSEIEDTSGYVFVWVDHHDEAYQWAERRKLVSAGNIFQIVKTEEIVEEFSQEKETGLFSNISKRHLRRFGVPDDQFPLLAQIKTEADLQNNKNAFHSSVYEALNYLALDFSIDEIYNYMGLEEDNPSVNVSINSLSYPVETSQDIITLNSEFDIKRIQQMQEQPLSDWRVFLHASQRKIIRGDYNGPVKIVGGAGTGKTVVAIHRAKQLAENLFLNPQDKILLTTFTVNLASEIKNNLRQICEPRALNRIDVLNVDKLITNLFREQFPDKYIAYGKQINTLWQQSIEKEQYKGKLQSGFFKEEWSRVIVPQKIQSLQEYWQADRVGRGTPLSRKQKRIVWKIFEKFITLSEEKQIVDIDTACTMLQIAIERGDLDSQYASIVVDEVQDLNQQTLRLLRLLCGEQHKNDMFLVGDAHQRIYRKQTPLSHCGIETRGRSYTLRINYRTTEQIRRWAFDLFDGQWVDDLDKNEEDGRGYISLFSGPDPAVVRCSDQEDEINHILGLIEKFSEEGKNDSKICIALRTNNLVKIYRQKLQELGLRVFEIKTNKFDEQNLPGVRIATMHRVKGLEFDHMILAAVNDGLLPLSTATRETNDSISRKEIEDRERALLYVAATRAKKTLHVLYHGKASRFLKNVELGEEI